MKLQEFISKDLNTIQAPKTIEQNLKQQLFEAIDSSNFKTFVEQKDDARLVTTTKTTTVNNTEVLVTTAKPKDADDVAEAAPAADDDAEAAQAAAAPAEDATYTFETPQATTTFRTLGTVIEVNGIAEIGEDSAITADGDGTTITATITQQGKAPIQCKDAEVSLANASEVTVTGGTVTQLISGTTINFELNTVGGGGEGGDSTPPSVTINNGVITMTGGGNQVGTLTLKDATKKIATITSPVKIEPNDSGGVVITTVSGNGDIQYSDDKTAKSITIELDGTIKADGNTIGGGEGEKAAPSFGAAPDAAHQAVADGEVGGAGGEGDEVGVEEGLHKGGGKGGVGGEGGGEGEKAAPSFGAALRRRQSRKRGRSRLKNSKRYKGKVSP